MQRERQQQTKPTSCYEQVILKVDESTSRQTLPDQIREVSQKNISVRSFWKQNETNYSSK